MKKVFTLLLLTSLSCLISCNNKVLPLTGSYRDTPYEFATTKTKDQAWEKLIDLLTKKGMAIKTLDKTSGVITTDNTSFISSYAFENKDGSLTRPDAMVVCSKVRGLLTLPSSLKPDAITGQWAILVKEGDNKTIIDTKLSNAMGRVVIQDAGSGQNTTEKHDLAVKSTGVFEKTLEDALR